MALVFKDHLKKAKQIDIRLKTGKFYPCTKENIMYMATNGKLSEANLYSLFTAKSIQAFNKAKANLAKKEEKEKAKEEDKKLDNNK